MASTPQQEPEVKLTHDLKDLGCPYPLGDDRATIWLNGYHAGLRNGGEIAVRAVRDGLKR